MRNKHNTNGGCMRLVGLLTILFIGLKLTNYIAWSWWLALSPVLIFFAVIGLPVIAFFIIILTQK